MKRLGKTCGPVGAILFPLCKIRVFIRSWHLPLEYLPCQNMVEFRFSIRWMYKNLFKWFLVTKFTEITIWIRARLVSISMEKWIRIYGQSPSGLWQQISLSYSAFCSTLNNRYANSMGRVWSKDSAVPWVCRSTPTWNPHSTVPLLS